MATYEPTTWECGDVITAEKMNKIERGVTDIMSEYVPTEWSCGDVITAEKLNKIEQGIADASGGGGSSDFTIAEISFEGENENDNVHIVAPFYDSEVIYLEADAAVGDGPYELVIAPSGSAIILTSEATITVSGDIEHVSGDYYNATGDCTITIS